MITQAACAVVEAIALIADQLQGWDGQDGENIRSLIDKYGFGSNAVIGFFQ